MEEVENTLRAIIAKQARVPNDLIKNTTSIIYDLNLDSLDHDEIIMEIEYEFDIHLSPPDVDKVNTLKDIVWLVQTRQDSQKSEEVSGFRKIVAALKQRGNRLIA